MKKLRKEVLVDIFNWIQVSSQRPDIFTRGIYRHAHKLALEFQPCFYLSSEEAKQYTYDSPFMQTVRKMEVFLGKNIYHFHMAAEVKWRASHWISIGMDNVSPVLPLLDTVPRLAVLHDVMSYRGVFGPQCRENFLFGATHHDVLLPVSNYALAEYFKLPLNHAGQSAVPYGCFHTIDLLTDQLEPLDNASYSVSTVEPRKRVVATVQTAKKLGFAVHHHVGAMEQCEAPATFDSLILEGALRWHRGASDEEVQKLREKCPTFFCLSSDEGFSMTPMEAILGGTPWVFLSDIPAHREVYGSLNVNFLRIGQMPDPAEQDLEFRKVSNDDRTYLFEKYRWENVIKPLKEYVQ